MSEDHEKVIKELLGSSNSAQAKSIVYMAIKLDKLADAIIEDKNENKAKFKKLQVWFFFYDNPKWLWLIIVLIALVLSKDEALVLYKTIFK